jgi:hypothetical protein
MVLKSRRTWWRWDEGCLGQMRNAYEVSVGKLEVKEYFGVRDVN